MKRNKSILLFSILLLVFSCDKDSKYDEKKAVLAFENNKSYELDKSLDSQNIVFPKQKNNNNWTSSASAKNNEIENIAKNFTTTKNSKIKLKNVTQYWSFYSGSFSDKFVFAPVIFDNKVFNLDSSGVLRSFDLEQKKLIFKKRIFPRKFLKNYQNPKITYDNDVVFAIAGTNRIVAVSAKSAELVWQKDISSIPISTPLVDGDILFVATNDNKVYALNSKDGSLLWVQSGVFRSTAIFGSADLVVSQDKIIASFSSGEIYAINKKTGEVLWSNNLSVNRATDSDFYLTDIDATPVVKEKVVYAIGNGGLMMAINIDSGNYLWKKEIASIANFWLVGEYLFVITNDNKLLAINRSNGGVKWIKDLPDYKNSNKPQSKYVYNGIVVAGNKLIISRIDGHIIVASAVNGNILVQKNIAKKLFHLPIVVNDKIFFFTLDKFLTRLIVVQ